MKLKILLHIIIYSILGMVTVSCNTNNIEDTPPLSRGNEFNFFPENPISGEQVSIVTNECSYYVFTSIVSNGNSFIVNKHFNSQQKWACIPKIDTIPLGIFDSGDFEVTLRIIDSNPMAADSIWSEIKRTINVGN